MQSSQTFSVSSTSRITKEGDLISLLFFMMGAMNIYMFLRRQRDWLSQQGLRLLKVGLISGGCAALLETLVF